MIQRKKVREMLNKPLGLLGLEIVRKTNIINAVPENFIDIDADAVFKEIYTRAKPFTMTGKDKMYAMYKATEYLVKNATPGDIVECGAYRGGSLMVSALTLKHMGSFDKKIYAYDTYEGMTAPTEVDVNVNGLNATEYYNETKNADDTSPWCYASFEEAERNLLSTGYPKDKFVLVKGKVEDMIPKTVPRQISLLRLDSDWYESTYHELKHLFPLIAPCGVIIIDDYGHWGGQKKAVDEYFKEHGITILLNRIEYSGRIGIVT